MKCLTSKNKMAQKQTKDKISPKNDKRKVWLTLDALLFSPGFSREALLFSSSNIPVSPPESTTSGKPISPR